MDMPHSHVHTDTHLYLHVWAPYTHTRSYVNIRRWSSTHAYLLTRKIARQYPQTVEYSRILTHTRVTNTISRTQAHALTLQHLYTHTHTHTPPLVHIRTHTHKHGHIYVHTSYSPHSHTHTHTHVRVCIYKHTRELARSRSLTLWRALHTGTLTYTRTHTHTLVTCQRRPQGYARETKRLRRRFCVFDFSFSEWQKKNK